MAKKKISQEDEAELKLLVSNYEMLQKTKEEALAKGRQGSIELIENAAQDTLEQIKKIDPKVASDMEKNHQHVTNNSSQDNPYDKILAQEQHDKKEIYYKKNEEPIVEFEDSIINSDVQYDIISLPSNGQCYKTKQERLAVSYLTAYDENLITSPNLYKDGLVIDFLLKHKVLDKNINVEDLCSGDADAITLFLRATSYGPEFPIIVKDPSTGKDIETVVDLSELKVKDFHLIGDENGYFDFTLPVSKDHVKFKFLTRKDERILKRLSRLEDENVQQLLLQDSMQTIKDIIDKSKTISQDEKHDFRVTLENMKDKLDAKSKGEQLFFNKTITNRLEMSIMSINGNSDRQYISKYIHNMGAKDSLMLRRYILENEPGIDFSITVNKPESLGGGSFKTFLEWDDSIFLNIA